MNLVEPTLLAAGLAVDSCLVALAYGLASREHRLGRALAIGATFGGFQGAMLGLGWLLGAPVASRLAAWDHWVAFGVLLIVGVRTIREGYGDDSKERPPFSIARLLVAGVATSLDALAAGFGVSLGEQPLPPALVLTTLLAGVGSILCFYSGRRVGQRWERGAHWAAGLVLIALGTSIVFEHLRAA
jgi:putative Mn2+ efflux pump MntP